MGLGADFIINHRKANLLEEVKKITVGRGVDIVIEHVGEATWESSLKALAPLGRLVTCGATTGYRGVTDIRHVFSKQLSVLGSYMGSRSDLFHALRFVHDGKVKPVVDKVFNLREASQAQQRMEQSEHFGKIVLRVP
jgi:NADPH:quinone reductase-like Zn-dependent oxidoreductase